MKRWLFLLFLAPFLIDTPLMTGCSPSSDAAQQDTLTPKDLKSINDQILKDPNNLNLYLKRSKYYQSHNLMTEAINDINRVLKVDSSNIIYLNTAADLYFQVNQTGRSKQLLERMVKLDPKNKEAMLRLAQLYHFVKMYQPELDQLNEVLKLDEHNAQAYFMKGMAWKEIGDTAKAVSSLETAIQQDANYYNAYIMLGIITAAKKDPKAAGYYEAALRIQPNSQEALYDLAKFYQETEDWNNAVGTYTQLLKVNPHHYDAHFNLGTIHAASLKVYDQAIKYFNEAISDNPKDPRGYYGRGYCYEMQGDVQKATADYNVALTLDPNYAPVLIAMQRIQQGNKMTGGH